MTDARIDRRALLTAAGGIGATGVGAGAAQPAGRAAKGSKKPQA